MNQPFESEQKEIVDHVNAMKKDLKKVTGRKGRWNKYLGSATNIIIVEYLNKHLPEGYLAVGPGVYVEGVPKEFDIIVVDAQAEPISLTNAYSKDSVYVAIEVKERGFFHDKLEAEQKIREGRNKVLANLEEIPFLYITLHESESIMKATRRVFGENAFFLSTASGCNLKILQGEWDRFVGITRSFLKIRQ
jgi:NurA-like 5'-3' nuclease